MQQDDKPVAWMYETHTDPGNIYHRQIAIERWPKQEFWTETPLHARSDSDTIAALRAEVAAQVETITRMTELLEKLRSLLPQTNDLAALYAANAEGWLEHYSAALGEQP
jgi:hypothetical protein